MRTPTTRAGGLIAAAVLTMALAGCGDSGGDGSDDAGGGGELSDMKVTFLTLDQACDTCATLSTTAVDTMEAEGVDVTMEVSGFGEGADQIQKLNQALSTDPDAIVVWPTDTTSIIPALERAKQTNPDVPIILTTYLPDTDKKDLWAAFVGADDETLGANQAEALVAGLEAIGKPASGGIIVIEGAPGGYTTIQRKAGFDTKIAEIAPDIQVLGTQPGNWDATEATNATSALLAKFAGDDVVGIFAHSDIMLNGALLAAERAGLTAGKDFVAVSIDCSIEGKNNIEAGKQYATGLWNPYALGTTTAETTLGILKGEDVEPETYVDIPEITASNTADCDAALGK